MRRGVLMLTAILGLAAPAVAAAPVVVARDGDAALSVTRRGHDLCLSTPRSESCGPAPTSAYEPLTIDDDRDVYAAAVVPEVATVEIERRDGRRRSVPTVSAPGLRSRFAVVARPGRIALVRFAAADGTLIGAQEVDLGGDRPTSVLRAFRDGMTVRVLPRRTLAPTVSRPDRVVAVQCLEVADSGRSCTDDLRRTVVTVCGPRQRVVFGALPAEAQRVVVTRGDGRTGGADAVELPDGAGFAVEVPARDAIRSLRATSGDGRTVATGRLGFPPCGDRFGSGDRDLPLRQPLDSAPVPVAAVDGHALVVATSGGALCAGVDRPQRPCAPAPYEPELFVLLRRDDVVGGVVAASVASVAVRRGHGPSTTVPAVADPRFPDVRFFIAAAPPGTQPIIAVARDAGGGRIGGGAELGRLERRRPLAHRRGRSLLAVWVDALGDRYRCVGSLGGLGADAFCAERPARDAASVEVGCRPAQAMVFGRIRRGEPRPAIRLEPGRTARVRVFETAAGRGFVAFPPPHARLRSITIDGRTRALGLPAATVQCGYGSGLEIG